MATTKLRKYLPLSVLVLAPLLLFGNSLGNGFVWDDFLFITYGKAYRDYDLKSILLSLGNGLEYLPVRDLSYLLDNLLWGERAMGYHLSNVLIYALTTVAVYLFTDRVTAHFSKNGDRDKFVPLTTALLFASHPLHSEVVSWVTGRNALLSGLFFFLSAYLFLLFLEAEGGRRKWLCYAAALLTFALSLLSKANGIVLPLLLALCVIRNRKPPRPACWGATVPFFLLAGALFFVFTWIAAQTHIMNTALSCTTHGCFLDRLAVAVQIPYFYLGKLLAPVSLAAEYDSVFAASWTAPLVLAAGGTLLIALAMAFGVRRKSPLPGFGLAFYLITLLPVLNLFPTRPLVADRYAYLPSFAFCFLLATAIGSLRRRVPKTVTWGTVLVVVLLWGSLAFRQNRVWLTEKSLWEHAVRVSPRSLLATTNLGRIYFMEMDYARAFPLFRRAREINPDDPHYDFFQGCFQVLSGNYREAIELFNQGLGRDDEFMELLFNLGKAYEAVGEKELAISAYRRVIRSNEPDPGTFRSMAREKLVLLGG